MKKQLYAIPLLTFLFMQIVCWPVAASDFEWQIRWQDNGTLQEEIHITGRNISIADTNWNISQEGDRYTLSREVENWPSYEKMKDRLPLQVNTKNYFVCKKVEIMTEEDTATGLFQQINDTDRLNLYFTVPGFIVGGSGEKTGESSERWTVSRGQLLQPQKLVTVITANGLLLGIEILVVGLLVIAVIFIRYIRKANRIIEEEYSLAKIESEPPKESE